MQVPSHPQRPSRSRRFPWYDSLWLSAYEHARSLLRDVAPNRLPEFEAALNVFRTREDFEPVTMDRVFDEDTMREIRAAIASLAPAQLELHEARGFKRFVVHDHEMFTKLQLGLVDRMSECVGEAVEPSYNFLSLYGPRGVCTPHLDAPIGKWTLDLCVNQSGPWPLYIGPLIPWPQSGTYGKDWEAEIKRGTGAHLRSYDLEPGQAVLFSGSSQWHWRDTMPEVEGGTMVCDLLFFHFIPKGTAELVKPRNWGRIFDVPELARDEQLAADF